MNAKTQIIVLLFSCLYGFLFYYLYQLNYHLIKKYKSFFKSIITIMFMYNIVLIYLICLYKINNGMFHIYFFFMLILGYISAIKIKKLLLSNVKFSKFIAKIKKTCYTLKK